MVKNKLELNVDASGIHATAGYIQGFSDEVVTDKYISSAVGYVQTELSKFFGEALDAAARAAKGSYLHVYEWGDDYDDDSTIGNPTKRLWKLTQMGQGKDRVIGYMFLPSVKPVPINPILLEGGTQVKEGLHIFTWKAPVMEYGMRVTIRRLPGTKMLAFVDNRTNEMRFAKGPYTFEAGVSPHGKPQQKGVFTGFFVAWWQTQAPVLYDNVIRPEIEQGLVKGNRLGEIARKLRRRSKGFSISTAMEGKRTFASARKAAREDLKGQARELRQATLERRFDKYGY